MLIRKIRTALTVIATFLLAACNTSHTNDLLVHKKWKVYDVQVPAGDPYNITQITQAKDLKNGYYSDVYYQFLDNNVFVATISGKSDSGKYQLLSNDKMISVTASNGSRSDLSDPQTTRRMQALMMMPDPYSFRQLFDSTSYNELHQYLLDSMHMELAALDHAKPFLFTTLLTMKLGGCGEIESPERVLEAKASAMHKPMAGLETLDAQMKIFDDIPDTAEVRMLMNVIHDQQKSKQQFAVMKKAYLKQDINELARLITDEPEMAPYRDIMIDNRNRNWIPIIEKQIQGASTFIACGAGHLGGANGVIELLRKQGYKVEPVR